jgi:hypothetical protein
MVLCSRRKIMNTLCVREPKIATAILERKVVDEDKCLVPMCHCYLLSLWYHGGRTTFRSVKLSSTNPSKSSWWLIELITDRKPFSRSNNRYSSWPLSSAGDIWKTCLVSISNYPFDLKLMKHAANNGHSPNAYQKTMCWQVFEHTMWSHPSQKINIRL